MRLDDTLMTRLDTSTRTLKKMMDTKFATITNPVCKDHARPVHQQQFRYAQQLCQEEPCASAEEVTNSPR
jgi:hypothetical protein